MLKDSSCLTILTMVSVASVQVSHHDNTQGKLATHFLMKATDLIRYIVWFATERETELTTVRLVKFLYLADLYYARAHNGETLTSLPWAFINYGPYCSAVMKEIDALAASGQVCRTSLPSKFEENDYFLFTCRDAAAEKLEGLIPNEVLYPLRESIRRFGNDTQSLLDHVYFDTEPMENVRKGDLLDFSKARPAQRAKPIELKKPSKKDLEKGKEHIAQLVSKMRRKKQNLARESILSAKLADEVLCQALEIMEGDDLQTGLQGIARIDLE